MSGKILLVDDVVMFLEVQKGFLKNSPVALFTAKDGMEAFEIARKEQPDLIFMDLHMPKMNGAECCRCLKADEQLKKIPVVMVTTAGKDEDREACFNAGCNDFLTKPLEKSLFMDVARYYLPSINRRERRVPCRTKVRFRVYGVTLSGEIIDVSKHGIYLAAGLDLEAGAEVEVTFCLPDDDAAIVQAKGKVAWVNCGHGRKKTDMPEGFGVELHSFDPDSEYLLARYTDGL